MTSSEQSNDVSQLETDIISDSNIIPYSSYLSETPQKLFRIQTLLTQQDIVILYKEEIKDLKEKQNVENSFSGSNEQFAEIVHLKQNLFEQVQEKDCLMKTVSELKNKLKLEENRNIEREIDLEKKIKQLDNIIFKRGQSAQTKARESMPKLYDGNTILKMDTIVVPDSDETLELSEKSRSKMLLKEQDPFELKAQSQAKDTVIVKLKEQIKSLKGNVEDSSVKMDMDEIETLNIELEHRVTKLVTENEHLKQTYKQLYDSIKPKRVQSKEQCDALIKQVNIKSGEISDLNAKLQEQGLVIAALKNELRKLKGKAIDNKETEEALVLRDIVEHVKANYPQDPLLESAFRYTKVIQDLLSHISRSCPSINNCGPQLIEAMPRKKDKQVRFAESLTSTENTKPVSTSNIVSNKRVLHSTGVRLSTNASGSQPSGNTKKDRILQAPSSNSKNKVEAHPRNVKSSLNKKNGTVNVNGSAVVQNLKKQDNSDCVGVNSNDCMSSDNVCVSNAVNVVKSRAKPNKNKPKKDIWKPTGKVFTQIGYTWRPTGRTFTIVGNACPLTRITTTNEVPSRKPIVLDSKSPNACGCKLGNDSRKPIRTKMLSLLATLRLSKSSSGIWIRLSKHMTEIVLQLTNFVINSWYIKFGNDQVGKEMGFGRLSIGNVTISRVY
ncbi:hypothetical protein Tco_1378119 [Tanacetum coccineum]